MHAHGHAYICEYQSCNKCNWEFPSGGCNASCIRTAFYNPLRVSMFQNSLSSRGLPTETAGQPLRLICRHFPLIDELSGILCGRFCGHVFRFRGEKRECSRSPETVHLFLCERAMVYNWKLLVVDSGFSFQLFRWSEDIPLNSGRLVCTIVPCVAVTTSRGLRWSHRFPRYRRMFHGG